MSFSKIKKSLLSVFFLVVFYIWRVLLLLPGSMNIEHIQDMLSIYMHIYIYLLHYIPYTISLYVHTCHNMYIYIDVYSFPLRKLEQPHLSKALNKWWIVLDSSRKPNHLKGASLGVATGDMSKDSVSPKHEGPNDDSVAGSLKKQRFCSYSVFYSFEPHICIGWTLNLRQSTKKSLNSMKKTLQGAVQVSKHSVSCWKIWIFLSGKRIPRLWKVFLIPNEGKVLARKYWWIFSGTLFVWTERRRKQVFYFFGTCIQVTRLCTLCVTSSASQDTWVQILLLLVFGASPSALSESQQRPTQKIGFWTIFVEKKLNHPNWLAPFWEYSHITWLIIGHENLWFTQENSPRLSRFLAQHCY